MRLGLPAAPTPKRSLAFASLYLSLPLIILFLIVFRPPTPYFALLLAPIALAAVLYEFVGGALVALAATAGLAVLIALDPDAVRRAVTLREAWPILTMYLVVGPIVGWLAARERIQERKLIAINAASQDIAASLDLKRTLQLVMSKAAETLPMDAGALFQLNPVDHSYHVSVSHNLSASHEAQITFDFEEGVPGWVVKNRKPLIIPNTATDRRVHPYIIEEGVCSVLAVPLVAREQNVGVLNLYGKDRSRVFDEEALRLAEIFAAQAAYAIENAQLVDQLRQAASELEGRVARRTQQLRDTQAQIIQNEKLAAVGRLAASIAHEVNNPLQAIALQLQLIRDEPLPATPLRHLSIVQEEMARIAGIVELLLDFQRPKTGRRQPQEMADLLRDVLALAGKQLQQAKIKVKTGNLADLPYVLADENQLKQVFLNLVLNAMEAMPAGGELQISADEEEEMISLQFTDNGPGMEPEVLSRIFEPFFSTKPDGTGIGLWVSHEIISRHGGTLEAQGTLGKGATFIVRLPVLFPEAKRVRADES
jgi:signal transduction histidine kinase